MRKSFLCKILFIFIFLLGMTSVKADNCKYTEQEKLQEEASKISIKKSVTSVVDKSAVCEDGQSECIYKDLYEINILNLSDNLYIEATNDLTEEEMFFTSKDADEDGIITFTWDNIDKVTHFTFKVYASEKTECYTKYLAQQLLTLPRKNEHYYYRYCDGIEDNELCQEYVEYDEIPYAEQVEKIKEYKASLEKEETTKKGFFAKLLDFLKSYGVFIVLGIIVIGAVIFVIIKLRKREK